MSASAGHLLFCMTPGIGLRTWERLGTLERELKPYLEYLARGWRVTILTYDRPGDVPSIPPGFELVCIDRGWLWAVPLRLRPLLQKVDVIKTNQSSHAWWYVLAANLARRPIVLRCGWLPGASKTLQQGRTFKVRAYRALEGWAFRHATAAQVATTADKEWVCREYGVDASRVHLRPNFIDAELFKPLAGMEASARSVVYVGRLTAIKRPRLLIDACKHAGVERLTLIGDGELREELEAHARIANVNVVFAGTVPQRELPAMLQQSQVFAMTSIAEGHPKALFEAMASSLSCVAVRAPGMQEAIQPDVNGLLTDADASSIAAAFERLFSNALLRGRLGRAARDYVVSTLDFGTIMDREFELVQQVRTRRTAKVNPTWLPRKPEPVPAKLNE